MIGIGRTDRAATTATATMLRRALRGVLAHAGRRTPSGTASRELLDWVTGHVRRRRDVRARCGSASASRPARDRRQRPLLPLDAAHAVPGHRRRPRRRGPGASERRRTSGASSSRSRSATTSSSRAGAGRGACTATFASSQVFRIDHYLGKETVQNILVFRFANGIFEPVWNRNFIDHVQITVAESIGVEGRGRFYEEAGALRDIVQNHMLQVLSFVAMEPPASFDAEAVRDERGKALASCRPLRPSDVVRGQYDGRLHRRRAGRRLPRGGGRRARLRRRDLRRGAPAHRQLALGRTRRSTCAPASGCRSA